jgi:uroporphyrinogen III methyltransferase/synthase
VLTQGALAGKKVLLARADIATDELPAILDKAGAEVRQVILYRTVRPQGLPADATLALSQGAVDWITFTSSSTAENFLALAPRDVDLSKVKLAAIGPVTAGTLRAHNLTPTVTADPHTIDALVEAIRGFKSK